MATASRSSRVSARTATRQDTRAAPVSSHPSEKSVPKTHQTLLTNGTWIEPPLRTPVPSFMDHKGLERGGVLEGMQALGSMPPARSKVKARLDVQRRVGHAKTPESNGLSTSMLTPEAAGAPTARGSRASSALSEATEVPESSPALEVHHDEIRGRSHQPSPAVALAENDRSSPALSTTSGFNKNPSASGRGRLRMSIIRATASNRTLTDQIMRRLTDEADSDVEVANLIDAISAATASQDLKQMFKKKAQEILGSLKPQRTSSRQKEKNDPGKHGSRSSPVDLMHDLPNIKLEPAVVSLSGPRVPQLPETSVNNQPKFKIDLQPSLQPIANALAPIKNAHAAIPSIESQLNLSRRSSSSSLSSIDEMLVDAGPPPPSKSLHKTSSKRPPTKSLKRCHVDLQELTAEEEAEVDERRKRMRRNFDDVQVMESHVRPQIKLRLNKQLRDPVEASVTSSGSTSVPLTGPYGAHGPPDSAMDFQQAATFRNSTPPPLESSMKPTKAAGRTKMSPIKNKKPVVIAGIAIEEGGRRDGSVGLDQKSQFSDNNDFCSSCGGEGLLLCCDGCDRSFHFTCLDPPLEQTNTPDESWLCYICKANSSPAAQPSQGLFAQLLYLLEKKNPSSFFLPEEIREFFECVRTGDDGEYVEAPLQKPRGRIEDVPDLQKLKDVKGDAILCYACDKSSLDHRDIVPCDFCTLHWHLDCLNPPLAIPPNRGVNAKFRNTWMCPNHIDHDLRHLDPIEQTGVRHEGTGRTHRVRRPRKPTIIDTSLRRGFRNNGLIDVASDSSDDSGFEEDEDPFGAVYRIPARGIKLDFIARVKSMRIERIQAAADEKAALDLKTSRLAYENQVRLSEDINRRSAEQRQAALNMVQMAEANGGVNLGTLELDILINALEAEAPTHIGSAVVGSGPARNTAVPPPSPPPSDRHEVADLSKNERAVLLKLQELIRKRLNGGGHDSSVKESDSSF